MTQIFITSSVLITVMALARLVLRKRVSQRLIYGLWLLVALRLLVPVQFGESKYSVTTVAQPAAQQVQQVVQRPIAGPSREEVYDQLLQDYLAQTPTVPQVPAIPEAPMVPEVTTPAPTVPAQVQTQLRQEAEETVTAPSVSEILTGIWIAGIAAMAIWFFTANLLFLRKIRRDSIIFPRPEKAPLPGELSVKLTEGSAERVQSTRFQVICTSANHASLRPALRRTTSPERGGIGRLRLCPHLDSPCLVGFFRPTVCLTPACLEDEDILRHVLAHETTHLRHGDHIWSVVRCVCLCIYWFNPLVWLAAILSKRDQELACDEAALQKLGEEDRIPYGKTLLTIVSHTMAPGKILQTATSMSETKKQLKERIEFIVKRPKNLWFAAISVILIAALTAGCVFTGKPNDQPSTSSTGTTEPTDPTISTEPEPASPLYEDILKDYDDLIAAQLTGTFRADYSEGRYQEGEALTRAQKRNEDLGIRWGYMLWDMTTGLSDPGKNSFGSITRDINGDGVPELFWIREDKTLLAVFTIIGDEPIVLDAYWARCDAVMTDDGKLYRINSGGAANSYYDIMTLSTEGKLVAEQSFGMNGGSAETGTLYYEVVDGEQTAITEARFNELLAAYPFQWGESWFDLEPSSEHYLTEISDENIICVEIPNFIDNNKLETAVSEWVVKELEEMTGSSFHLTPSETKVETSGVGYTELLIDLQSTAYRSGDHVTVICEGILNAYKAAHPTNLFFAINLDAQTGQRIWFRDVYAIDQDLYQAFYAKAKDNYWSGDYDYFAEGMQTEEGFSWYPTGDGIVISYPVIFALGNHMEVTIPFDYGTTEPTEPTKPIYIQNPPDSAFYGRWTAHIFLREGSTLSYSLELSEDGSAIYTMGYYGSDLLEKMEGTWHRTEDGLYLLELTPVVIHEDTGVLTYLYQGVYQLRAAEDGSLIHAGLKDGPPLFSYLDTPDLTLYPGDYYDIPVQYP